MEPVSSASDRGRLLVAAPPLVDPNFDRTVVLVLEHGEDGALGIVLNRPTERQLTAVVPDWAGIASAPAAVFVGGPVAPDAVIALARGPADGEGWVSVLGDLGTVDLGREPGALGVEIAALRIFVGYSGWAPGQLDDEVARGGWFPVDAHPADPFTTAPATLWRSVLRRQRGRLAMFAECPADPSVN